MSFMVFVNLVESKILLFDKELNRFWTYGLLANTNISPEPPKTHQVWCKSMGEYNTILSAYTLYRHLG